MPNRISTLVFFLCFLLFTEHSFASFRVKSYATQANTSVASYPASVSHIGFFGKLKRYIPYRDRYSRQEDLKKSRVSRLAGALSGAGWLLEFVGVFGGALLGLDMLFTVGLYLGMALLVAGGVVGVIALAKNQKRKFTAIMAILSGLWVVVFFAIALVMAI